MELSPYTLQIFTSLVVILGAAFVALICDYLKGNNEQLRELTIELKIRREEEHMRVRLMLPSLAVPDAGVHVRSMAAPEPAAEAVSNAAKEAAPRALAVPRERKRAAAAEAMEVMERGAQLAGAPRRTRKDEASETVPVKVNSPAAESPASTVEAVFQTRSTPSVEIERKSPVPKPQLVETASADREPQRIPEQILVQAMAASQSAAAPARATGAKTTGAKTIAKKDWNSLLSNTRRSARPEQRSESAADSTLLNAIVEAAASTSAQPAGSGLPCGLQENFVLSELLANHQVVSGLVVSVGVSMPREGQGALAERVSSLMRSLLGPADFAVHTKADEFLLIFPHERGGAAQRRLSQLAQQLWDFQLHSLGSYSVLFSWGGLEVRAEALEDAIASATERMLETKRGRRNLVPEGGSFQELRRAV